MSDHRQIDRRPRATTGRARSRRPQTGRSRRLARTAAVLGAVLVAGLVVARPSDDPPAAAQRAEPAYEVSTAELLGVNTHLFWHSTARAEAEYRDLVSHGVTRTRETIPWMTVEPSQGTWRWENADRMMTAASRAGIDVLGVLSSTPPWASSDPSAEHDPDFPPSSNADFAGYTRAVVQRYGPGGTFWTSHPELRPQPLRAVELWNEPWGYWAWNGGIDPVRYSGLAYQAALAVERTNPRVEVLISGDLLQVRPDGQIRGWVDQVLAAEPRLAAHVDAFSVHPYHDGGPLDEHDDARWDYRKVELIHDIVVRAGADRPVWITEVGWSTATGERTVDEATQARYLREAVVTAAARWPWVERLYVYSDDTDSGAADDREGHFGLRRADGSRKPAWYELIDLATTTGRAFTDVGVDHPAADDIAWLADAGIAEGYPDGSYRPEESLSRGAMAAYLHRLAGSPSVAAGTPFRDVPAQAAFHDEISWLADQRITTGYADGTFRPDRALSRAAMAAYLHRLEGRPSTAGLVSPFPDVPRSHPFHAEIAWLAAEDVAAGYADGTFRPSSPLSRGAMAAYLRRLTEG